MHVDMDAFYVSVELVRRPELRGRPVVVGGTGRRGVVAASSYEARAYGVHSAMPSTQAQRLCPHATFLSGDHDHYREVSSRVMAVFADVTPLVEPLSLDEAFLDISGTLRSRGSAREIAASIRDRIWREETLTCSVGIAPNKFLAKLGSEQAKPKASPQGPIAGPGTVVIEPDSIREFLDPLPVRALWGVGPATGKRLSSLGIETIHDLAQTPVERLVAALGSSVGRHVYELAHGRDGRAVEPGRGTKSISHEETFAHDLVERDTLDVEIIRQADAVSRRLRSAGLAARTVQLKIRFGDFTTYTRRITADQPFTSSSILAGLSSRLLDGVYEEADVARLGVRLLGVGVTSLLSDPGQQLALDLDATSSPADSGETDSVVDDVRARFGTAAIGPASSAMGGSLRIARRGAQQWGPDSDGLEPK